MKTTFLEKVFNQQIKTDQKLLKDEEQIISFRNNQIIKAFFASFLLIVPYYLIIVTFSIVTKYNESLPYYIHSLFTVMGLNLLLLIIIITNKTKIKLIRILTYIQFVVFYASQLFSIAFYGIYLFNSFRLMKHLYTTYIYSCFILVFLLKANTIIIAIVSVCNLLITVIAQVYYNDGGTNKMALYSEIVLTLVLPLICMFVRREYRLIIKRIETNMNLNKKILKYSYDLIDNQSSCIIMLNDDEIVLMNQNYLKMNEKVSLNVEDNENRNDKELLMKSKFCFIDGDFNELIKEDMEGLMMRSSFDVLCSLIKVKMIEKEKFYFMGIIQTNTNTDNFYFNVSFRKMNYNNYTWLEVFLNDVTLSKNIQTIDDAFKLKETILGKIAHEFKTPLICMLGLSEEIQNSLQDEININKIVQITDLSNYTLFLINDIIHFLRNNKITTTSSISNNVALEEQNLQLKVQKNNIKYKEINDFSFRILKTLLMQKQKNIIAINDNRIPHNFELYTDSVRLKQIILNFINNAVKFTKAGSIRLKSKITTDNKELIISVIDSGVGIKEEDFSKLFKEFNMLQSTISINQMGSGLGLSICQSLAVLLGYKLSFKSVYGKGSTFSVLIPLDITFKSVKNAISTNSINTHLDKKYNIDSNTLEQQKSLPVKKIKSHRNSNKRMKISELRPLNSTEDHLAFEAKNDSYFALSVNNNSNYNDTHLNGGGHNGSFLDNYSNLSINTSNPTVRLSQFNFYKNCVISDLIKENDDDNQEPIIELNNKIFTDNDSINQKIIFIDGDDDKDNPEFFQNGAEKKKILIIDDSKSILNSLVRLVKKVITKHNINAEIITGCDGVDLIKYIIDDQNDKLISIVFVDEIMEYINGSQAMKILKCLENESKVILPIICKVSADNDLNEVDKGEFRFIRNKPMSETDVESVLLDIKNIL